MALWLCRTLINNGFFPSENSQKTVLRTMTLQNLAEGLNNLPNGTRGFDHALQKFAKNPDYVPAQIELIKNLALFGKQFQEAFNASETKTSDDGESSNLPRIILGDKDYTALDAKAIDVITTNLIDRVLSLQTTCINRLEKNDKDSNYFEKLNNVAEHASLGLRMLFCEIQKTLTRNCAISSYHKEVVL